MKDWLALAKPRITFMVALCAAAGYALAPGAHDRARLAWTIVGVALAAASTGCLNQVLEAELDGRMTRTRGRPIPAGRVSPATAHALGWIWGAVGLGLLAWKVNATACGLTAFTLASYLLVYTPMKRFSPASTWVGAIPGAMPPVIGWAAAGAALGPRAGALFSIQFLWQLPHFLALAWIYREDYARGGYQVLAVVDPDGGSTGRQMVLTAGILLAVSVYPYILGMGGPLYLAGALVLSAIFLAFAVRASRNLTSSSARGVFLASLAYLPLVLGLLVAGR
ncbi:MAG: heme o synthase [Elusimicrobiota bacterium]